METHLIEKETVDFIRHRRRYRISMINRSKISSILISNERFLDPGEVSEDTVYTAYFKRKEFNVRFLDNDGSVISEAKVKYGHSAIAPNPPIHDGFNFTGWDKKFDYITGDLDITAAYKPNSVLPGDKGDDGDTDNDDKDICCS